MSETLTDPRYHELVSNDQSIRLQATHTPGEIHTVEIEQSWPASLSVSNVTDVLFDEAQERGIDVSPGGTFNSQIYGLTPYSALDRFASPARFGELVDNLGYSVTVQAEDRGGEHVTKKVCRYPSVDRANRLLFRMEIFGEDTPADSIRFAEFTGGEYSMGDFMTAFVEEGEVLMASEQPYQIHDLSDHLLGWIGMDPELVGFMRRGLAAYMAWDAELASAALQLPLSEEQRSDKDTRRFLSPASVVVQHAMSGFEAFTGELAEAVIFDKGFKEINQHHLMPIADSIGRFTNLNYGSDGDRMGVNPVPNNMLGERPDSLEAATQSVKRYLLAQEVSRSLKLAAAEA